MRRDDDSTRGRSGAWRASGLVTAVLGAWLALAGGAWAQASPAGLAASQPTPPTEPRVGTVAAADPVCPARPAQGITEAADVLVTLDPATLWRPRGGEVHFNVSSKAGATIAVQRVQVCLGWSAPRGTPEAAGRRHALLPSPVVRPIAFGGSGALYGAEVPDLPAADSPWLHPTTRTDIGFTALDTVPVADMVVVVTLGGGGTATVLIPVGITSVTYASVLVALCVGGFFLAAWLLAARDRRFVLDLIGSPDGYASLSQFQIALWTVTVGASAVYVMVLSGNLIDLTGGTLVLLGIAGGADLTNRIAPTTAAGGPAPAQAAPGRRSPRWSDLVVVGGDIDLTRVQMLVFTLVSAAFVTLKVIVGYVIPDIPANFLLLMGISNGIYVVGRRYPPGPDAPLKA